MVRPVQRLLQGVSQERAKTSEISIHKDVVEYGHNVLNTAVDSINARVGDLPLLYGAQGDSDDVDYKATRIQFAEVSSPNGYQVDIPGTIKRWSLVVAGQSPLCLYTNMLQLCGSNGARPKVQDLRYPQSKQQVLVRVKWPKPKIGILYDVCKAEVAAR